MINQDRHACLADFGLTAIVSDPAYPTTFNSSVNAGTARWMSPERLNPIQFGLKDGRPTKESDCYALGMVVLEVLSGQVPFTEDPSDFTAMQKILDGVRPERPQGIEGVCFTDELWVMLQRCWLSRPAHRPTAEGILECLIDVPFRGVLLGLGIESHLVPFAISAASCAEQSLTDSPTLTPTEAKDLVEILDQVRLSVFFYTMCKINRCQVVSSSTVNPSLGDRCFKILRKVSQAHAILPKSYYVADVALNCIDHYAPFRFANIWRAELDGRKVSMRAFPALTHESLERTKRVCQYSDERVSAA